MIERSQHLPTVWDEEADLVVVGSGAAGLTAAVVCASEGASVLVLEKADVIGGTTSVSGGGFWIPLNHHMSDEGVEDSREEALEYMRACAGGQGDDDCVLALLDEGRPMVEYLETRCGMAFRAWPAQGGTIDYRPWLPGAKRGARTLDAGRFETADLGDWAPKVRLGLQSEWRIDKFDYYRSRGHVLPLGTIPPRMANPDAVLTTPEAFASGSALVAQLLKGCLEQGVSIDTDTPVKEILVDGGRVVGVLAHRNGEPLYVRAARGVLMATGGYGMNDELKRLWMTRPLDVSCDVDSNTGDGHLMGIAVGAGVSGLGDAWWMPQMAAGRNADGSILFSASREDRSVPHTMLVNGRGRRFMNEGLNYYDAAEPFGTREGGFVRNHPAWYLFDDRAREKYMIVASKFPEGQVPDWMIVADSVEQLAQKLEIDPGRLARTVERFNEFARTGHDEDFERGDNDWDLAWGDPSHEPNPSLGTMETPPFYALEVRNGALATRGGLHVNGHGQVLCALRPYDPIPGLYAAGNCSSGSVAGSYPGAGATIGAAMTFGYIAAHRVASGVDVGQPTLRV